MGRVGMVLVTWSGWQCMKSTATDGFRQPQDNKKTGVICICIYFPRLGGVRGYTKNLTSFFFLHSMQSLRQVSDVYYNKLEPRLRFSVWALKPWRIRTDLIDDYSEADAPVGIKP